MSFFKGDDGIDDGVITDALIALRKRVVKEITTEQTAMIWKITSIYQCLIRRTIEAADGMRMAWNARNLLTAFTMGRSLIETTAIVKPVAAPVCAGSSRKRSRSRIYSRCIESLAQRHIFAFRRVSSFCRVSTCILVPPARGFVSSGR
jgi:hypothetical protein